MVLEMHGSSQDAQGSDTSTGPRLFWDPVDVVVIYAIVETFFMYSWAVAPAQGGSANCYPDRAFPGWPAGGFTL